MCYDKQGTNIQKSIQESVEKVNEINRRLKEDGFNVAPPKRLHGWTFYVKAPGGFTVEVLAS
ncbi:glyoxalase [Paenibacillus thiaminolyticus]|nr:glyoxalase [Paenibacillus thiaminolyticus]